MLSYFVGKKVKSKIDIVAELIGDFQSQAHARWAASMVGYNVNAEYTLYSASVFEQKNCRGKSSGFKSYEVSVADVDKYQANEYYSTIKKLCDYNGKDPVAYAKEIHPWVAETLGL